MRCSAHHFCHFVNTTVMIVNSDDASKFSLSIDAGGREADILAAGTTPLNSDPIVFTIIAIARGTIITITIARGSIITIAGM